MLCQGFALATPALGPDPSKELVAFRQLSQWLGFEVGSCSIMVVDNLLTPEECDHMIRLAEARLEPSTVVNVKDGSSIPSTVRTSYGSFLNSAPSETVDRVNNRLADLTMLPPENGEAIQVRTNQRSPRRCALGRRDIVEHSSYIRRSTRFSVPTAH
jgi:hypothetical protein